MAVFIVQLHWLTQDEFLAGALVARRRLTLNPPNDNGFDSSLLSALVGHGTTYPLSEIYSSSFLVQKKGSLKSGIGLYPPGITLRVLKSPHVKSQSLEKHAEASNHLAALTVIATPAFGQSFDPDSGTGNIVMSLGSKPTAPLSDKIAVR